MPKTLEGLAQLALLELVDIHPLALIPHTTIKQRRYPIILDEARESVEQVGVASQGRHNTLNLPLRVCLSLLLLQLALAPARACRRHGWRRRG